MSGFARAGIGVFALLGCGCARAQTTGAMPTCGSAVLTRAVAVQRAASPTNALPADSGALIVRFTSKMDHPELLEAIQLTYGAERDTSMRVRMVDGKGIAYLSTSEGTSRVRVRAIGYQTVTAAWRARSGFMDTLRVEMRFMPCAFRDTGA